MISRLITSWKAKRQAERFRRLFVEPYDREVAAIRPTHKRGVAEVRKRQSDNLHLALRAELGR